MFPVQSKFEIFQIDYKVIEILFKLHLNNIVSDMTTFFIYWLMKLRIFRMLKKNIQWVAFLGEETPC